MSHMQDYMMTRTAKSPPAMQETQVGSLSWKDPLEKGMATHTGILAWRSPWTEKPGGLPSMGTRTFTSCRIYMYICMYVYDTRIYVYLSQYMCVCLHIYYMGRT